MRRIFATLKGPLLVFAILGVAGLFVFFVLLYAVYDLPSTKNINGCFKTTMYEVDVCPKSSKYVNLSQIPQYLQWAVLLSEDAGFYSHDGLDWFEIKASLEKNISERGFSRGGSTLTQQLVKNLYLTKDKTLLRKFKELLLTIDVERTIKKKKILELYFNVVEFAPNVYGIKQAAQHYFNKSTGSLTVSESLFLATILPNPKEYSKSRSSRTVKGLHRSQMKRVAMRLLKTGRISQESYSVVRQRIDGGFWQTNDAMFMPQRENISDELFDQLEQDTAFEASDGQIGEDPGDQE